MKKHIAKKWVAALRSGDYKQGKSALRGTDSKDRTTFCCLGVLCNLHAQAHPKIAKTQTNPEIYLGEMDFLPEEVREWAGMKTNDGSYGEETHWGPESDLANDNDAGVSFKKIADIIEAHVDEL